jgi:hypothetical protein
MARMVPELLSALGVRGGVPRDACFVCIVESMMQSTCCVTGIREATVGDACFSRFLSLRNRSCICVVFLSPFFAFASFHKG